MEGLVSAWALPEMKIVEDNAEEKVGVGVSYMNPIYGFLLFITFLFENKKLEDLWLS